MTLLLTAGVRWPVILWTLLLDEVTIATGLVGAIVSTRHKWACFAGGCVAMAGVYYSLAVLGRKSAGRLGADVLRTYTFCGALTIAVWTLYPIAWGLSEGGNLISPDSEVIFYGVLDLLAKPLFSVALIWGLWKVDLERVEAGLGGPDSELNCPPEKIDIHGDGHSSSTDIGVLDALDGKGKEGARVVSAAVP
jgi:bacteriorhodopsin